MFLLKIAYYGILIVLTMITAFMFVSGWMGKDGNIFTREKIVLLLASISTFGVLYFAFKYGHLKANWAAGIGFELLAVLAFAAIMLLGTMTGKTNWQ